MVINYVLTLRLMADLSHIGSMQSHSIKTDVVHISYNCHNWLKLVLIFLFYVLTLCLLIGIMYDSCN